MVFKPYSLGLIIRLIVLFSILASIAWIINRTDFVATVALLILLAIICIAELLNFVRQTNLKLGRFLEAIRHTDFSPNFELEMRGTGFSELAEAMKSAMETFRAKRVAQEREVRYLRAIIEHVPTPLISVNHNQDIHFLNNAARRFFASHDVRKVEDLSIFGSDFPKAVKRISAGERRLVQIFGEGTHLRATLSAAEIISKDVERLVSIQNISSELEATELEAWQRLVGVLTHEIMNSLTPVSSLAETARDLLRKTDGDPEALADARDAVETVARRSGTLMAFVQNYRELTRLPVPDVQKLSLADLFAQLKKIALAGTIGRDLDLNINIAPANLSIIADPAQIEQILINLLCNASEALHGCQDARIDLSASLNRHGRVVITVSDNGPGISDEIAEKIFVPFFTTKNGGSGIGLALARQVMIAHNGSIALNRDYKNGTSFTLIF